METSHYFRLYQALSSSLSFYNVNCTYDAFTEIYSFIHSFYLQKMDSSMQKRMAKVIAAQAWEGSCRINKF